jgi:DNA-binding MarR family transcriptional regulator
LDLFAVAVDAASFAVLIFMLIIGYRAVQALKTSRKAVTESASLLDVIVDALSVRIRESESAVNSVKSAVETINKRSLELEGGQGALRSSYLQVLGYLEEIMSNDARLVLELEQLKKKIASFQPKDTQRVIETASVRGQNLVVSGDILTSLTPTERQTIEILAKEGGKAAPELGKRLRKSREHTARLMKKLYLEGYLDRESNYAPYRYKLNERVRTALEPAGKQVTAKASEKV